MYSSLRSWNVDLHEQATLGMICWGLRHSGTGGRLSESQRKAIESLDSRYGKFPMPVGGLGGRQTASGDGEDTFPWRLARESGWKKVEGSSNKRGTEESDRSTMHATLGCTILVLGPTYGHAPTPTPTPESPQPKADRDWHGMISSCVSRYAPQQGPIGFKCAFGVSSSNFDRPSISHSHIPPPPLIVGNNTGRTGYQAPNSGTHSTHHGSVVIVTRNSSR